VNTFRFATRRINTRRYQARTDRRLPIRTGGYHARMGGRELLTAMVLCAAIFACAFVIGRDASSSTSAPREGGPWGIPVVSTGAAIPTRLSTAPPVQIEAPAPVRPAPKAQVHSGATKAPVLAPVAEGGAAVAPVSPPPAPAAAAPVSPPRTPAPAPAPSRGTGTRSPEAGKSFETSG
jgi:hypothetical protein